MWSVVMVHALGTRKQGTIKFNPKPYSILEFSRKGFIIQVPYSCEYTRTELMQVLRTCYIHTYMCKGIGRIPQFKLENQTKKAKCHVKRLITVKILWAFKKGNLTKKVSNIWSRTTYPIFLIFLLYELQIQFNLYSIQLRCIIYKFYLG